MKNFILVLSIILSFIVGCAAEVSPEPKIVTVTKEVVVTERPELEVYKVDGEAVEILSNSYGEAKAFCRTGDTVIGGGCAAGPGGEVRYAIPMKGTDGGPDFFLCFVLASENAVSVDPQAICAKGKVDVKGAQ